MFGRNNQETIRRSLVRSKMHTEVVLCDYCLGPFEKPPKRCRDGPSDSLQLCAKCARNRGQLVLVTCSDCGENFPRFRRTIKLRRRWCRRAFCPACHAKRVAPKTVNVDCSECGRTYERTRQAEQGSRYRGCKRRICPICRPAKMKMEICKHCRKPFPRLLKLVLAKQRMGHRHAVCPRCVRRQSKTQTPRKDR